VGRHLGIAAVIWGAVQGLARLSSAAGPGTTIHDAFTASNNLAELAGRTCISPATAVAGAGRLFTVHWPAILGTAPLPLSAFSIESRRRQGMAGSSWLPALIVVLAIAGLRGRRGAIALRGAAAVRQYLVLAGAFSVGGLPLRPVRRGQLLLDAVRAALAARDRRAVGVVPGRAAARGLRAAWGVAFAAWIAVLAIPQIRFGVEYATRRRFREASTDPRARGAGDPLRPRRLLARVLHRLPDARADDLRDPTSRSGFFSTTRSSPSMQTKRSVCPGVPCAGGAAVITGVYRCP
jgi:hypothetical protein